MFDNNKNIKVGRDINIQIEKSSFERLEEKQLLEKEENSKIILNKEFKGKLKQLFYSMIFGTVLFILVYFGLPYLLGYAKVEDNSIPSKLLKGLLNKELILLLSGLAAFKVIIDPLLSLGKKNDMEEKHSEILKAIRMILKEREYLKDKE